MTSLVLREKHAIKWGKRMKAMAIPRGTPFEARRLLDSRQIRVLAPSLAALDVYRPDLFAKYLFGSPWEKIKGRESACLCKGGGEKA